MESLIENTQDAFLGGKLTVAQARHGSRAGVDAVFLAAACPASDGQSVLDLGTGSGIVALSVATRVAGASVTGVEIDPDLCALAEHNAQRNHMEGRAQFVAGDVTGAASALFDAGLRPDSFDHVVANPPFFAENELRPPQHARLRRAHCLEPGALERWVKAMAIFARPGGSISIVHRADALGQLLSLCAARFGALTIFPLFPRAGRPASRILIQGKKASRAPSRLMAGMILHESGRDFSAEASSILCHGTALDLGFGK